MQYLKFHNSKIIHILAHDEKHTLCGISNTASEIFDSYAGTDYPLPQKINTLPENAKICQKCQDLQPR